VATSHVLFDIVKLVNRVPRTCKGMSDMNTTTLMTASHQWAKRPADERFVSLTDMLHHSLGQRDASREVVVRAEKLTAKPEPDNKGLLICGPKGNGYTPSHWAFGQIANLVGAPASYLREKLPSPIVADCLNWGFMQRSEDVGILLEKNGTLRAATGPKYGRIWDAQIIKTLVDNFGDGDGAWRVPGEFGKDVTVNKDNTTLYRGDRDMFVFLADEKNRIELPNRRNGKTGTLARGFFVWNSEVGSSTFGISTFLFDYVCCNRIVWGATEYQEIKLRHTVTAPDRWIDEIKPAIRSFQEASSKGIVQVIDDARADKLKGKVDDFLANRFGKRMVNTLQQVHMNEEQRPIENRWDVVTAATAYARQIEWQNERVAFERLAGDLLAVR
jgi:hypothetical protein